MYEQASHERSSCRSAPRPWNGVPSAACTIRLPWTSRPSETAAPSPPPGHRRRRPPPPSDPFAPAWWHAASASTSSAIALIEIQHTPAMAIDPRCTDLERFAAEPDAGPLVMLNLLRFTPGGRARYEAYLVAAAKFVRAVGGDVVYAGLGGSAARRRDRRDLGRRLARALPEPRGVPADDPRPRVPRDHAAAHRRARRRRAAAHDRLADQS